MIRQPNAGQVMQGYEPSAPVSIWAEDAADGRLPRRPVSAHPWDMFSSGDDVLVLRKPYRDRAFSILLSTIALAASFALGWTGGLNWPELAPQLGLGPIAQREATSSR